MISKILKSTIEDASPLAQLINSAYRGETSKQGWTTEADLIEGTRTDASALVESINTQGTFILKYLEGNTIVGCVELVRVNSSLYLGMLTVKPELQGMGIGKELLKASEVVAEEQNCKSIFMTVISIRTELVAWYKRCGYTDTGKRKPFNFNDPRFGIPKQKLEFVVLEKELLLSK